MRESTVKNVLIDAIVEACPGLALKDVSDLRQLADDGRFDQLQKILDDYRMANKLSVPKLARLADQVRPLWDILKMFL